MKPTPSNEADTPPRTSGNRNENDRHDHAAESFAAAFPAIVREIAQLRRIGLPSDELDRLRENHPEAYEIHLAEQRTQPAHERDMQERELALAEKQVDVAIAIHQQQLEDTRALVAHADRQLSIAEKQSATARKLTVAYAALAFATLTTNALLVWHGKVDGFALTYAVFGGGLVTGVLMLARDMVFRPGPKSGSEAPSPATPDEDSQSP